MYEDPDWGDPDEDDEWDFGDNLPKPPPRQSPHVPPATTTVSTPRVAPWAKEKREAGAAWGSNSTASRPVSGVPAGYGGKKKSSGNQKTEILVPQVSAEEFLARFNIPGKKAVQNPHDQALKGVTTGVSGLALSSPSVQNQQATESIKGQGRGVSEVPRTNTNSSTCSNNGRSNNVSNNWPSMKTSAGSIDGHDPARQDSDSVGSTKMPLTLSGLSKLLTVPGSNTNSESIEGSGSSHSIQNQLASCSSAVASTEATADPVQTSSNPDSKNALTPSGGSTAPSGSAASLLKHAGIGRGRGRPKSGNSRSRPQNLQQKSEFTQSGNSGCKLELGDLKLRTAPEACFEDWEGLNSEHMEFDTGHQPGFR